TQGEVGNLQVVLGEVAFGQIAGPVRLIVQAVVGLRGVADVRGFAIVEFVIDAAVVAILVERSWDDRGNLRGKSGTGRGRQLSKGIRRFRKAGLLALSFERKKAKQFVLDDRASDGATKKLAFVRWLGSRFGRKLVGGVEFLLAEEAE